LSVVVQASPSVFWQVPVALQAWQVPQALLVQQKPSVQLPLMHWLGVVHARPFALRAQLLVAPAPWHVEGATQSLSPAQVVLHAAAPQTYGEQLDVIGVAQLPAPVQWETGVKVDTAHEAAPQAAPTPACWQAPAPLQLPVLPQGGFAGQPVCGSGTPTPTFAHAPVAQAWHRPHDDDPQHTPSTQKLPVRQSVVVAQLWPSRRLVPHRLVWGSQMSGDKQSASTVHAALHAEIPLHR
jgi:hypothetical protein